MALASRFDDSTVIAGMQRNEAGCDNARVCAGVEEAASALLTMHSSPGPGQGASCALSTLPARLGPPPCAQVRHGCS